VRREEESQVALPRLMSDGLRLDLAFVDGDHRFDPAFVDLYLVSRSIRLEAPPAVLDGPATRTW
jgi:hypothetical protein